MEQMCGRQRVNIHGTSDLGTSQTRMIETLTTDAASTIYLLESAEVIYSLLALIRVFINNAPYHRASSCGNGWLSRGAESSCISFRPTART